LKLPVRDGPEPSCACPAFTFHLTVDFTCTLGRETSPSIPPLPSPLLPAAPFTFLHPTDHLRPPASGARCGAPAARLQRGPLAWRRGTNVANRRVDPPLRPTLFAAPPLGPAPWTVCRESGRWDLPDARARRARVLRRGRGERREAASSVISVDSRGLTIGGAAPERARNDWAVLPASVAGFWRDFERALGRQSRGASVLPWASWAVLGLFARAPRVRRARAAWGASVGGAAMAWVGGLRVRRSDRRCRSSVREAPAGTLRATRRWRGRRARTVGGVGVRHGDAAGVRVSRRSTASGARART